MKKEKLFHVCLCVCVYVQKGRINEKRAMYIAKQNQYFLRQHVCLKYYPNSPNIPPSHSLSLHTPPSTRTSTFNFSLLPPYDILKLLCYLLALFSRFFFFFAVAKSTIIVERRITEIYVHKKRM